MWKGGSEPRLRDRIRGIRWIRWIIGSVPKYGFVYAKPYFSLSGRPPTAPGRPWVVPGPSPGPLGQLWEVLEELWEAPGGMFKTKICFVRKIKAPAGMQNTKSEFVLKIKAPAGAPTTKSEVLRKIKAPAGAPNTQAEFFWKIKAPAGMYEAWPFLILYNILSCLYMKGCLVL